MYTSQVVVYRHGGLVVTSYGHGAAYQIEDTVSGRSVFLQDAESVGEVEEALDLGFSSPLYDYLGE